MHASQEHLESPSEQTLWKARKQASMQVKRFKWPGVAAHTCNPSYLGGRDREDRGSRPTWASSVREPISTNKSWAQWCLSIIPAMQGGINRRISVQARLGRKQDPSSKKKEK
jgi:hypothetical protein